VFFTEFDRYNQPRHSTARKEREPIARALERKLKLLLLTKAHVVVAASQLLESPFAHDLLQRNPILLESRAIVSSMKLGHASTLEFLDFKRNEVLGDEDNPYHSSDAAEVAQLIDDVGTSVRWELSGISNWFRDRLAEDLADDQSLLRVALRREGIIPPPSLAGDIRDQSALSRGAVDKLAAATGVSALRDILKVYADFVYYLSGARTTQSEGVLPQENLVDFSIGELLGGRSRLSEHEVFFKIFIDMVKAKTSTVFPTDFLDSISIADAIELRAVAISKSFTDKYNTIQLRTKEAIQIRDPERLVLLLGELDSFETELYQEFGVALDNELPAEMRQRKQRAAGEVLHSVASVLIPGYAPEAYRQLVVSGLRWSGWDDAARSVDEQMSRGLAACASALEAMNLLERRILLGFVEQMKRKYQNKMFGTWP